VAEHLHLSVVLLAVAMKPLPVGTSILGMILFGEPATPGRLTIVGFIVVGIVGSKLASA